MVARNIGSVEVTGSIPVASSKKNLENQGLPPTGIAIEPRGNRYGVTEKADIYSQLCG